MTRLVILQSNYLPWKGYFDLIDAADVFVVYDSVQYTKNDWRNRNLLQSRNGPVWLTVPVETAGRFGQSITDARLCGSRWAPKHWRTVQQILGRAPHFDDYSNDWSRCFEQAGELTRLHDVNMLFLRMLTRQLGTTTRFVVDRSLPQFDGSSTERLVKICRHLGATSYLTGPSALSYMDTDLFHRQEIRLEVFDYGGYETYSQQAAVQFSHHVSVLDLLANVGPDAPAHLLGVQGILQRDCGHDAVI